MGYFFNIEKDIKSKLNSLSNSISSTILNNFVIIESNINKYFNQLEYIDRLKQINEQNNKYKLLYNIKNNENQELNKLLEIDYEKEHKFQKIKVLSYLSLNDNSKVIIDYKMDEKNKIYALVTHDGFSVGIVLNKENQNIAYLNKSDRCNYTVYIGKNNAPGITSGMNSNGKLLIKYTPLWKEINLNDEVITSGMDNIFPYGIKVGVVEKIIKGETAQEVLIKPYDDALSQRYFYLYDSSK
ncbi:MAG: rod shape-determining protein MreC [Campylobacterota bacterium]|nr:rod shape-determining protein MreC [Campylobacterota bacterium]